MALKHRLEPHLRLIQFIGVVVCVIPLLFPSQVPSAIVIGSLLGLVAVFLLGPALGVRAFFCTPLDLPLAFLLLLMPLNVLISVDRALTLPHVYKIVAGTAVFYAAFGLLREKRWFDLTGWGLALLGLVLGGLLLLGTDWRSSGFSQLPGDLRAYLPRWTPFWKPEGYRGFNVNLAGGTLALVLPVPLAFVFFGRRWWVRVWMLVESVALGLLLALSLSRGAIIGVGMAVGVMLVARDRWWLLLFAGLGLVLLLASIWLGPLETFELLIGQEGSGVVHGLDRRVELWSRGLYMMQDFSFTGVGMGLVEMVLPLLYPTFLIPLDADIEHVHNLYLQFGAETGFPGLIALLACLFLMLYAGWRAVQRARGSRWAPLAIGLLGTVVALMVHGVVDSVPLAPKVYLITWTIFGLALALDVELIQR